MLWATVSIRFLVRVAVVYVLHFGDSMTGHSRPPFPPPLSPPPVSFPPPSPPFSLLASSLSLPLLPSCLLHRDGHSDYAMEFYVRLVPVAGMPIRIRVILLRVNLVTAKVVLVQRIVLRLVMSFGRLDWPSVSTEYWISGGSCPSCRLVTIGRLTCCFPMRSLSRTCHVQSLLGVALM